MIAVTGQEGLGKTALSVLVGHRLAAHFPDAHLYYDLNGSDPQAKVTAAQVARYFLTQLGFSPHRVPDRAEECLSMLRSSLADRRVILVLDDVETVEQVRPLLFESAHALVMVTSRNPLAYLRVDGFRPPIELGRFTGDDAAELISAIAGRGIIERAAAARLGELCEGLPLAIGILAVQLPGLGNVELDELLSGSILKILNVEGRRPVEDIFDFTYQRLDELGAKAYTTFSLLPGMDFSAGLASHVLGEDATVTDRVLRELTAGYILHRNGSRYRFHNLVREHALGCAAATLSEVDRANLLGTAGEWYWRFAVSHDKAISRRPFPIPARSEYKAIPAAFTAADKVENGYAGFAVEWPNLIAAARSAQATGSIDLSVLFPMALWTYGYQTRRIVELIDLYEAALERATDNRQLWQLYRDLAGLHEGNRDWQSADVCIARAFAQNYPAGEASLWEWRGLTAEGRGDLPLALWCFGKARETVSLMCDTDQEQRAYALLDLHCGRVAAALGRRDDDAAAYAENARRYFAAEDEGAVNYALSSEVLGRILARQGQGAAMLHDAFEQLSELGINARAARIAAELAQLCDAAGRLADAAEYRRREQELND
ncbi:NB-ARC domain-containing protein [Fodinicola feengrottensis]|uniref:NB-ARC domain-containing protein n=1 Tax=Fodinicola feengrottensis TaxID=435914 RepID=UPI0031D1EBD5